MFPYAQTAAQNHDPLQQNDGQPPSSRHLQDKHGPE